VNPTLSLDNAEAIINQWEKESRQGTYHLGIIDHWHKYFYYIDACVKTF
jgi:hypothetical protein